MESLVILAGFRRQAQRTAEVGNVSRIVALPIREIAELFALSVHTSPGRKGTIGPSYH